MHHSTALLALLVPLGAAAQAGSSGSISQPAHEPLTGFAPSLAGAVGVAAIGQSFATVGGRTGQPFAALALEARRTWGALAADAALIAMVPVAGEGSRALSGLELRAGWEGRVFRGLAGVSLNFATGAGALWLPSLTLEAGRGEWRGVLGVLDRVGTVPLRLGVGWRGWSVCYVPALGFEAAGGWPLTPRLAIEGRVLAYQLAGVETVSAVVGARWSGP